MNTVASTMYDLLVAETDEGDSLESLNGRIFEEAAGLATDQHSTWPRVILKRATAVNLDACRRSGYVISDGMIAILIEARVDTGRSDGELAARESAETWRAAIERVLVTPSMRARSDGTWSRMTLETGAPGEVDTVAAGGVHVEGIKVYRIVIGCTFRFRRSHQAL